MTVVFFCFYAARQFSCHGCTAGFGNGLLQTEHAIHCFFVGQCGYHQYHLLPFFSYSIQIIKEKLDSEGLGIFLVSSFMEEFFSKTGDDSNQKQSFELLHYNGIKRSNESNKVLMVLLASLSLQSTLKSHVTKYIGMVFVYQ